MDMYDVPVTFSILAPSPQDAMDRVRMLLGDTHFRRLLEGQDFAEHRYPQGDHAFIDGYPPPLSQFNPRENPRRTHECDCMGH